MTLVLLTPDEVAAQLRVTRAEVQRLARGRQFPGIKLGRYWRFEQADIDAYVAALKAHSA